MHTVKVEAKNEDNKSLEITQPSMSDQQDSNQPNSLDLGRCILSFTKKMCSRSQIENTSFNLMPESEILFQRNLDESIKFNLDNMCFAEGIKVTRKSAGYRFVNFMLLNNDEADKYYCNMLIFS